MERINDGEMMKEEVEKLREENKQMKLHIDSSPDGALYYEAQSEWNSLQN